MDSRLASVCRGLCLLALVGFGVLHASVAAAQMTAAAGGETDAPAAPTVSTPGEAGGAPPAATVAPPLPAPAPPSPPAAYPGVEEGPAAATPEPRYGQRVFGVSANLGTYSGFALGLRAGARSIGAELSFGYLPILIVYSSPNGDPHLKLMGGYQINGGLYAIFAQIHRFGIGAHLGYKYNEVLKHGGGGGAYMTFDLTRTLMLHATVGITVYPEGEDEVVRRLPDPCEGYSNCSGSYKFSLTPAAQSGISVGLLFFPG